MSLLAAGLRALRGTLSPVSPVSPVLGAARAMSSPGSSPGSPGSLESPGSPGSPGSLESPGSPGSLGSLESPGSPGSLESLRVTRPRDHVLHVELNRPHKRNAMDAAFWREMVSCFGAVAQDSSCRAVVVSGAGTVFSAGIDLASLGSAVLALPGDDAARRGWNLRRKIRDLQQSFTALEKCPKPVIAAIHGACVGAGVDLISACDIRFCSQDAWFQVKEVDIGLAADVGTLQRLPKIVGSQSLVNELAFTARKMMAPEAQSCGLVSRVFADKEALLAGALEVAVAIAARSPVAVQGTKVNLLFSRDHSVPEGLRYVATWNMAMLQTEDILKSVQASMDKKGPEDVPFAKL